VSIINHSRVELFRTLSSKKHMYQLEMDQFKQCKNNYNFRICIYFI